MSERIILKLENVCKRFGGLRVLEDLNFDVKSEEIVGLIGPNGAGKSTVFNVVTAFYKPESGLVILDGNDITGLSPAHICHLGISRTYQLVRTFLKMTIFENAMVAAVYGGKSGNTNDRTRAMDALEIVGLKEKKNIFTANVTLSDRRLLEIAMALASTPKLILLDEPMAGLNQVEIENLMLVIERIRREREMSIIWIEHKIDAILNACDHVIVLDYGEKIADGKPFEIANNPKVIEAYLGEPIA